MLLYGCFVNILDVNIVLSLYFSLTCLHTAQRSMNQFHRPTRKSEPDVRQRTYMSPDQLRKLHFKPTVDFIRLSEGNEAKFNCSINIPDDRIEPTIIWVKNGQDLAANMQVVINELQTFDDISGRAITLLSTARYETHGGELWKYGRLHTQNDVSSFTVFQH